MRLNELQRQHDIIENGVGQAPMNHGKSENSSIDFHLEMGFARTENQTKREKVKIVWNTNELAKCYTFDNIYSITEYLGGC